ncbi:hypothetical protein Hanom_Chr14g01255841 [Helianthus anomalus]
MFGGLLMKQNYPYEATGMRSYRGSGGTRDRPHVHIISASTFPDQQSNNRKFELHKLDSELNKQRCGFELGFFWCVAKRCRKKGGFGL